MSHETPVYLGALDVGTSSIRCMVFNKQDLSVVCTSTLPIQTNHPYPGWVEQDPIEYVVVSSRCIADALGQLKAITNNANATLSCLGIANQRETTIAWDRQAMKPFANAIVWSDNRTQSIVQSYKKKYATEIQMDDGSEYFLARSGLPISTYFSSYKMRWLIENVPELREALEDPMQRGRATLTTVDSWLLFMLTAGECFVTDITNASRTNLMNLTSGAWDTELCDAFGIPIEILPRIVSNQCGVLGRLQESKYVTSSLIGIPITTLMGDQQAALFGHMCVRLGSTKCTYGTGCFLLRNIGSSPPYEKLLRSTGTVGTIAYKLKSEDHPVYALEGSIGVAGTVLSWIQKNWCHVSSPEEVTSLAASVPDTGDVYFVPAFSGLYSPLWDSDARGTIVGITEHTTTAHIVRSGLQAICFQVCDVINAMNRNSRGHDESKLKDAPASNFEILEEYLSVDGGVTNNNFLMQMQADFLQLPIQVPHVNEATSLGAAMMAGLSLGLWSGEIDSVQKQYNLYYKSRVFNPVSTSLDSHAHEYERWKDAVGRSRGWAKTSYGKP